MNEIMKGMKKSIPIALGYFPVAFSFGVLCVSSGLPLGLATFISLTNLTSSGQFAGVQLILSDSTYLEIAITLLLINFRYFLISLSLSCFSISSLAFCSSWDGEYSKYFTSLLLSPSLQAFL